MINEARALRKIEEKKAKERQLSQLKQGKEIPVKENLPERDKGRTRDKVAEMIGISGRQLEKLETVASEKPELLDQIDRGKNLARRHLSQEQRRELIRGQLIETPEVSNRQIAKV